MALRIMQNALGFSFSTTGKTFIIYKHKYLIEQKPKKAPSAYQLFMTEHLQKDKKKKSELQTEHMKHIAEKWEKVGEAKKKELEKKAEQLREERLKIIGPYEETYINPFKRLSSMTLFVKNGHKNNLFKLEKGEKNTIANFGKVTSKEWGKVTDEERKKLQEEANAINEKNRELCKKFEIPQPIYSSQSHYNLKNSKAGVTKTPEITEQLKKEFEAYCKSYEAVLEKWLAERGVTLTEYKTLCQKQERKDKRDKKAKEEESESEN